ncbi:MAG: glycosyltransferase family 39 protein [Chloroherpetonaceae bacterium]|nr:glycosyltransferase family 39 protein [Chloroherpetonaceae bacterium]
MNNRYWILAAFILAKFLLQYLFFNPEYDLQRDEFLHLDQANHLAWGFLSVPPLTSWISFIIKALGNSVFWVRFFPALFGALTIIIVWKAIEELKGNLFALILGATCILFSSLLRLNTLYQPNSFDVLSWTALYFILIKYFNSDKLRWLYIGSFVFAIGFLNKYNIVFLLIGLVPAVLLTNHRKVYILKDFYFALFLGFLFIFPNLWWQYSNNFPVFIHLSHLAETQLAHVSRLNFLKEQVFFILGSFPVIVAAIYALFFYKPFEKFKHFGYSFFFTLIVFVYFKAKGYYAIGLYPIYISFGSVFLSEWIKPELKKYFQTALVSIPIICYSLLFDIAFSIKSPKHYIANSDKYKALGLLRWEDGKDHSLPQDFADMLGWKELAYKVDSIYSSLPNRENTLILCDNYGQAGAINYYSRYNVKAVSFNADYINWFDLSPNYVNFIRIKESEEVNYELTVTSPYFKSARISGFITNEYSREFGTTILLFTEPTININERIQAEILRKKIKH